MLLRPDGDAVIAIGQASHAWLSGQLARAWRPRPEPWEEICLAAEQHDVGMAEWDRAPARNPETGRPQSFMEMALETHLALWEAAPRKLLTQSRHAALLVSLHGTGLYERRRDPDAAVRAYLSDQRAFQAGLAAELGLDPADLAAQQRLIALWDGLSLALCLDWDPYEIQGFERRGATLEPWPFGERDEVVVRCEGRRLEGRAGDEAELHAALERAPLVQLRFALQGPGPQRR